VLLAHPDYILLFVADFDFANPNSAPKQGQLYFKTEHRNLVELNCGNKKEGSLANDQRRSQLRVIDDTQTLEELCTIKELPRVAAIGLLFVKPEDATRSKAFLESQKERQIKMRQQQAKGLFQRWYKECEGQAK